MSVDGYPNSTDPAILTQVWLQYELFSSRHLSGSVWVLGLRVDFNCASCFKSPKTPKYLLFLLVLKISKDFLEHTLLLLLLLLSRFSHVRLCATP